MGKSDKYSKRCPFFGKAILIRWTGGQFQENEEISKYTTEK
jgi:hypothetical protein